MLSTLVHEASHYNLVRRGWLNELLGTLAGTLLATPVSAYRAVHMKHHQATNREDDPFNVFNTRWMILFGAPTAIALAHVYAWRYLRGRALGRYLVEMCGMLVLVAAIFALPRPVREWSLIGPLVVVAVFQNIHIITGHLDLPAGKYHDTWQLVLPGWLSVWMLHNDHHLEHHIFPRLNWYELPALREKLARARSSPPARHLLSVLRRSVPDPALHAPGDHRKSGYERRNQDDRGLRRGSLPVIRPAGQPAPH